MDLLSEIKRKIKIIEQDPASEGITAALRHIEVAEKHLLRARAERDDDLLNDVVYRTNQAFEGFLKEAYSVLTGKDSFKISTYQIEQHLLEEKLLTSRVLDLFKNYRQEWRNRSTHDHRIYFKDQEALLAIVSVSAFSSILLEQMIEEINKQQEKKEIEKRKLTLLARIKDYDSLSFIDQIVSILNLFSDDIKAVYPDLASINEAEIIGRLQGFFSSLEPSFQLNRDSKFMGRIDPDLLISKGDESAVLELKRSGSASRNILTSGFGQLLHYLHAGKFKYGILYVLPTNTDQEMNILVGGDIYIIASKELIEKYGDKIRSRSLE
jgi:hypothetical protein